MYYNKETSNVENYNNFRKEAIRIFNSRFSVYDLEICNDLTSDLIVRLEESLKKSKTQNIDSEYLDKAFRYTFDSYLRFSVIKEQWSNKKEEKSKEEVELDRILKEEEKEKVTKSKKVNFEIEESKEDEFSTLETSDLDLYFIEKDLTRSLWKNNWLVFNFRKKWYKLVEISPLMNISYIRIKKLNKRNEEFLKKNKERYL